MIITADHGNIEQLIDYDTGKVHTAHTINRVPVILIDDERKQSLPARGNRHRCRADGLQLLGLPVPPEMTGHSLIVDS